MIRAPRPRPQTWQSHKSEVRFRLSLPLQAVEWCRPWAAYYLGRWAFLEVLEYLSTLSVLVVVVSYFAASGERLMNTAQGKGGSGGRIEALQELNQDGVLLVGLDAGRAFLMGIKQPGARLSRSGLEAVDLRGSDLSGSEMSYADLNSANLRKAVLRNANLQSASLEEADLAGADLTGADT